VSNFKVGDKVWDIEATNAPNISPGLVLEVNNKLLKVLWNFDIKDLSWTEETLGDKLFVVKEPNDILKDMLCE
jgi:hypothetical protein